MSETSPVAEAHAAFIHTCSQVEDRIMSAQGPVERMWWLMDQALTERTRPTTPDAPLWWGLPPFPGVTDEELMKIGRQLATAARKVVTAVIADPDAARTYLAECEGDR